jgi:hypothetical protein
MRDERKLSMLGSRKLSVTGSRKLSVTGSRKTSRQNLSIDIRRESLHVRKASVFSLMNNSPENKGTGTPFGPFNFFIFFGSP